jgi:hypothetical protein
MGDQEPLSIRATVLAKASERKGISYQGTEFLVPAGGARDGDRSHTRVATKVGFVPGIYEGKGRCCGTQAAKVDGITKLIAWFRFYRSVSQCWQSLTQHEVHITSSSQHECLVVDLSSDSEPKVKTKRVLDDGSQVTDYTNKH